MMSTFKIYSSKENNARNLGKWNALNHRSILILLPVTAFVIAFINKILHFQLGASFWIVYIGLIIIVIGYSLFLIKNLIPIGKISFFKNEMIKKIGDLTEQWDYSSINKITVREHFRDIFFQKNILGIRAYYLEVRFKDKRIQRFVVSSVSDEKEEYGLKETLNSLSKTGKVKVEI